MVTLVQSKRRLRAPLMFSPAVFLTALLAMPMLSPPTVQARELPPIRESQPLNGSGYGGADSLSLSERVTRLEDLLEGQVLVDMLMRIEALQQDIQELRGQGEVHAHEVKGIKKRQRDLYLDIDRRLRQLLQGSPAGSAVNQSSSQNSIQNSGQAATRVAAMNPAGNQQSVPVLAPQGGAAAITSTVAAQPAIDLQAEKKAYRQAFDVLKAGRYEASIKAFGQFYKDYPQGQYADNAVYWMGEANYVLRRFSAAIERFNRVLNDYPNSPKLADAMLKIGFSHYELQAWSQARQVLEDLGQRYPSSTAAQLAQNRLHKMKVDGK